MCRAILHRVLSSLCFLLVFWGQVANGSEGQDKATFAELGLTPLGAEQKGNEAGTIPAWKEDEIFTAERLQKIASESPLFYITEENVDANKTHLTEGQQALIATYPETFKIPVYKSHRTHHVPQYIYQAAEKNYHSVKLIDEGNGITDVWQAPPFPVPENAIHVIWNHLIAWRGIHIKAHFSEVLVQADGSHQVIGSEGEFASPYYAPNRDIFSKKHVKFYYLTRVLSPARLAGGGLLIHDTLNQRLNPRKSWLYDTQQRRVIRIPTLEHDSPNPNSERIRVVDEVDLFNGTPERYDWQLLGKKELYIPYNNQLLTEASIDDFSTKHHINLKKTRFELHRVWVVEGKLKKGYDHIYPRRRLYFDEDTWLATVAEQYNRKDQLWRVSLSYTKNFPDMPGVWKIADTFHDLKSGQHFTQIVKGQHNEEVEFFDEMPPKRLFSPSALRKSSKR